MPRAKSILLIFAQSARNRMRTARSSARISAPLASRINLIGKAADIFINREKYREIGIYTYIYRENRARFFSPLSLRAVLFLSPSIFRHSSSSVPVINRRAAVFPRRGMDRKIFSPRDARYSTGNFDLSRGSTTADKPTHRA